MCLWLKARAWNSVDMFDTADVRAALCIYGTIYSRWPALVVLCTTSAIELAHQNVGAWNVLDHWDSSSYRWAREHSIIAQIYDLDESRQHI